MAKKIKYFDRELSWLEFNQRVLDEALNDEIPLLERLKFLAISGSNLDEFFRVRIGAMKRTLDRNESQRLPSGLTTESQLQACRQRIETMVRGQYDFFLNELTPQLDQNGIHRAAPDNLTATQKMMLQQHFDHEIFSVLAPMAVEEDGVFPLLPNLMLNVIVRLENEGTERFAIIPFGQVVSRMISVPSESGYSYMLLEDVLRLFIDRFFSGETVKEVVPFRVTRNAEVVVEEETPSGLARNMAEVLRERSVAECVRLEVDTAISEASLAFLQKQLRVEVEDVMRLSGPIGLTAYMDLSLRRGFEHLQYEPWPPVDSADIPLEEVIFDTIAERDILLYHPYESFDPVVRFVQEAAEDPDVIAIKQTLYRISRKSPIISALKQAVSNGKHVTVLLELKARFDEERNLLQARELEAIGAQVIWGVKGLKTHAKVCIVVRREPHGIQRYVHFGTGNYNEATARIYSDASLFTCKDDFGTDAVAFFNAMAGYSQPPQSYLKLESAPLRLRSTLIEMIQATAQRAQDGKPARIMIKLNAITDTPLIDALYEASQAGVKIDLNIRGICCLKPGVKGLSENIRVVSLIDRFLEHARIICFQHANESQVFISSADWMTRNLDHRKELLVPVEDSKAKKSLQSIMQLYFQDNVKASVLNSDGTYTRREPGDDPVCRAQQVLYQQVQESVRSVRLRQRTMFEPHQPEQSSY